MEELQPKTIIINSLDLSSKDYRRKEELLYTVMEWLGTYDVSIVIFSELRKRIPKQGKIQQGGGVGKFAAIAEEIQMLGDSEEAAGRAPAAAGKSASQENLDAPHGGLRVRTPEDNEISLNGLRVRSTGVIEDAPSEKHYPMSNRYRALVKDYEKEHGKQQQVGES